MATKQHPAENDSLAATVRGQHNEQEDRRGIDNDSKATAECAFSSNEDEVQQRAATMVPQTAQQVFSCPAEVDGSDSKDDHLGLDLLH